jgi:HD-like signal output (HDOD) protein
MNTRVTATSTEAGAGAVDFLLRRMQRSRDFPALSETVRTLNSLTAADEKSTEHLASVIVRDFALTNKILKVVNSAYYAGFAGKVGTISRAMVVLGIQPIRALAASLILFEQLAGESNADRVRALIGKSMFSALLARELAEDAGLAQGEEAFLAAMFHNLGELLVAFYLPEEDEAISSECANQGVSRAQAQLKVLGVDFQHLGIAIGRTWNFPHAITYSMKGSRRGKLEKPASEEDILRQLAGLAHDVTDGLALGNGFDDALMKTTLDRYRNCVDVERGRLDEVVSDARSEYRMLAESLASPESAPEAIRALTGAAAAKAAVSQVEDDIADVALPDDRAGEGGPAVDAEPILFDGLQEATSMLSEGDGVNQIAQVVLESIYRGLGLRRVALCLRDPARRRYCGRIGFGEDIDVYLDALRFDEAFERDVFHVALKRQTDVHIADLAVAGDGHGIPTWYRRVSPRGAMLFLPLLIQKRPVGCIIAEHAVAGGLVVESGILRLVRALRNQLALAMQLKR